MAAVTQIDDRVCEGGQEVEISLSRMKDELLEELGLTQVRLNNVKMPRTPERSAGAHIESTD